MAQRQDNPIRRTVRRATGTWLVVAAAALIAPVGAGDLNVKKTMKFAADMAELGNWREARYRWQGVQAERPSDGLVLNNLAVAAEALGDIDEAGELYERAVVESNGEPRVLDNYRRFDRFRRRLATERQEAQDAIDLGNLLDAEASATPADSTDGDRGSGALSRAQLAEYARRPTKKTGKVAPVTVEIPLPPKLDIGDRETLLVASFMTQASGLMDTNRELVRFLRNEFRKQTPLEVLDVVPPPAIPEQQVHDLLSNSEFWKYLAREYGADLIVSGVVRFTREDASGFRDVDTVSPTTGQKIRQTRFVEQEEFIYVIDVFFIDGETGTLLFRDRVNRSVIFRDQNNDPFTAFYEMSDSLADDVLSVVVSRTRVETRNVFRTG